MTRMTPLDRLALAAAGALFLTIPVFAFSGRRRPSGADARRPAQTSVLSPLLRAYFFWLIGPLERAAVRAKLAPEIFNYLGVALGAAAGVSLALNALSLGAWLILLAGVTDVLDGRVARALGLSSRFGAFLDSSLDRFVELFFFLGLAWRFAGSPTRTLLTAAALGGSLLVSYTRAKGEAAGVDCARGVMQRAERFVLLGSAALLDAPVSTAAGWPSGSLLAAAVAVIAAGSLATSIYRTAAIGGTLKGVNAENVYYSAARDEKSSTSSPSASSSSASSDR